MKCKNCNYELKENDLFCPECGTKVVPQVNEELETSNAIPIINEKKKKAKKKIAIIASSIIVAIVLILGGIFYFVMQPKDINLEASELIKLIDTDTSEKYNGDNLYVHGYLYRGSSDTNTYVLAQSLEDIESLNMENFLYFVYDEKLDEELGTNSEITVKGKLAEKISDKSVVFHGLSISVQNKVKPLEVTYKTCSSYEDNMTMEVTLTAENDKLVFIVANLSLDPTISGIYLDKMTLLEKQEVKNALLKELGIQEGENVVVEIYGNSIILNLYVDLEEGDTSLLKVFRLSPGKEYQLSDVVKSIEKGGGYCE